MKGLIREKLGKLLLLLVTCASLNVHGQQRAINEVKTEIGASSYEITVLFTVPVRYVSHLIDTRRNGIDVQLTVVATPGAEPEFLGGVEGIAWRPTAEIPLERIVFRSELAGGSSLQLLFGSPIKLRTITERGDRFSLVLELQKERVVDKALVERVGAEEPTPAPLEQIVRLPATAAGRVDEEPGKKPEGGRLELPQEEGVIEAVKLERKAPEAPMPVSREEETEQAPATTVGRVEEKPVKMPEGNYVINLLSQAVPVDFSKIGAVPIGPDQRLYSTVVKVKGTKWHRLRVGFYQRESEAKQALKELAPLYQGAWIDVVSPEEKRAFFLRIEEAPGEPIRLDP
ncbi:MAG: SPOR domain-containing protein [Chromatiales bacterium]|nr:SPOR domain-containing protein [Chromatiales bacterium]